MRTEIINIDEIQELLLSFAEGDYSKRLNVSDERDKRDTIVAGINMLGEELERTTVSRDYFSNIYNAVSDLLFVIDENGFIIDVNKTVIQKIILPKNSLINRNINTIFTDEILDFNFIFHDQVESYHFDSLISNSKDEYIHLTCSISKITSKINELKGFLVIAKDTTKNKEHEQHLLNVMLSTQEKERKRIAYDLHDSLGQELNAIKMYLNTLSIIEKDNFSFKSTLEQCKLMMDDSINTIRELSFDLMPKSLENGNLIIAIDETVNKLNNIQNICYTYNTKNLPLKKETEIIIYRIIQEFISNSLKYANAKLIQINIKKTQKKIIFSLNDDGIGFDIIGMKIGNGIYNMKTRLKAIKSNYSFKSIPNNGTSLIFQINHENN